MQRRGFFRAVATLAVAVALAPVLKHPKREVKEAIKDFGHYWEVSWQMECHRPSRQFVIYNIG